MGCTVCATAALAPFVDLLQRYYAGDLLHLDHAAWTNLASAFLEESRTLDPDGALGLLAPVTALAGATPGDLATLEHEFNRLFVGPARPVALPVESFYREHDGLVMQRTTLGVRAAYREAGVEVGAKNRFPDDHLAFELAFVAHLLASDAPGQLDAFSRDHLLAWAPQHAAGVLQHSEHPLVRAFAELLTSTIALLGQTAH